MLSKLKRFLGKNKSSKEAVSGTHKIIITKGCLSAIRQCLAKDIARRHEGVAYLIGQVTEDRTIAVAAICPKDRTTYGSFSVTSKDMAHVIRTANKLSLQVVGQVHSHPRDAFHSDGDEDGANIAYKGYVSIVLPQYGKKLPSLDAAAFFLFNEKGNFIVSANFRVEILDVVDELPAFESPGYISDDADQRWIGEGHDVGVLMGCDLQDPCHREQVEEDEVHSPVQVVVAAKVCGRYPIDVDALSEFVSTGQRRRIFVARASG